MWHIAAEVLILDQAAFCSSQGEVLWRNIPNPCGERVSDERVFRPGVVDLLFPGVAGICLLDGCDVCDGGSFRLGLCVVAVFGPRREGARLCRCKPQCKDESGRFDAGQAAGSGWTSRDGKSGGGCVGTARHTAASRHRPIVELLGQLSTVASVGTGLWRPFLTGLRSRKVRPRNSTLIRRRRPGSFIAG